MKEFDVISFEELFRILNAIPINSTISICTKWEQGVDNLRSYQVEDWYGIKKMNLFDSLTNIIIIGWWGGGEEAVIPLNDDFVHNFSIYAKNIMDGTSEEGKICIDMEEYRKAIKVQ